jgi:hypothetical protein
MKNTLLLQTEHILVIILLKKLLDNNVLFVIRIKNNITKQTKKNTDKDYVLQKCTFVYDSCIINKIIYNKKNNKNVLIKNKNIYNFITNLDRSKYNDKDIINIYKKRWDIEVFFKLLKNNFKLENVKDSKADNLYKLIYVELIITLISKIIKIYYFNNKKDKFNKINESNILKGIFRDLMKDIIKGKLTKSILDNFINSYIIKDRNKDNRNFERVSLKPFSKWYIKKYHTTYKYNKLIEADITKNNTELNKNLKYKFQTKEFIYDVNET